VHLQIAARFLAKRVVSQEAPPSASERNPDESRELAFALDAEVDPFLICFAMKGPTPPQLGSGRFCTRDRTSLPATKTRCAQRDERPKEFPSRVSAAEQEFRNVILIAH